MFNHIPIVIVIAISNLFCDSFVRTSQTSDYAKLTARHSFPLLLLLSLTPSPLYSSFLLAYHDLYILFYYYYHHHHLLLLLLLVVIFLTYHSQISLLPFHFPHDYLLVFSIIYFLMLTSILYYLILYSFIFIFMFMYMSIFMSIFIFFYYFCYYFLHCSSTGCRVCESVAYSMGASIALELLRTSFLAEARSNSVSDTGMDRDSN